MGKKIINPLLEVKQKNMNLINPFRFGDTNFRFTINTALGAGASFTLPLRSGYTYDLYWDPGDGSAERHVTAYNDANASYTYPGGNGTYQCKIRGTCGAWYFNNGGDKLKLTKIDNWGNIVFSSLQAGFYGCINLNSIASDKIKCTGTVGNDLFNGCTSLTSIPSGLLDFWTNLINFSVTFFGCTSLTAIPSDLFRYNININAFAYTFANCTNLINLPDNLFYYNPLVTSYLRTFDNNRNMILPSVLFNLSNLSIVTTFDRFMYTTSSTYSSTGTIQDIWNYALSATHLNTFTNQTALSNYASIPNNWKGL